MNKLIFVLSGIIFIIIILHFAPSESEFKEMEINNEEKILRDEIDMYKRAEKLCGKNNTVQYGFSWECKDYSLVK
jgi:hypothetical protein